MEEDSTKVIKLIPVVCLDLTLKRCIVDFIYICALKEKCFPDLLMRNGQLQFQPLFSICQNNKLYTLESPT